MVHKQLTENSGYVQSLGVAKGSSVVTFTVAMRPDSLCVLDQKKEISRCRSLAQHPVQHYARGGLASHLGCREAGAAPRPGSAAQVDKDAASSQFPYNNTNSFARFIYATLHSALLWSAFPSLCEKKK